MVDDGLNDDSVLWDEDDLLATLPPRQEHNWIPYEPHTTSNQD
jgi:hypothetical protein